MRISDIITLRWEHFNGEHITLKTQKTGSTVSILLPTKALEIINLYKPEKPKKNDFIFPFIDNSENTKDAQRFHTLISRITAYTNTDLSDLAKKAKIDKHVHFHNFRHTWATRALKKGMRIEYVSKLMGHSSIRTTQVYAKIVNADLDNTMKVFEDKPPAAEENNEKKQ
jgi:integrase